MDDSKKYNIDINEVKWFYKEKDDNTCKQHTNTKTNTIINDFKWTPFNKFDSFNLEKNYQNKCANLIQVLDNLYEVNLETKQCNAIYWKAKTIYVMRSVWFSYNGEPLEEKSSDLIENKHLDLFKDQLVPNLISNDVCASNEPICSIIIDEGIVNWYSKDDVYLEKTKMSVIDKMHLTILKLRKKLNQINRIYRGFKENNNNEQSNKNPQEITHLIFVVHGIAQKLDRKKIFKCCDHLAKRCVKVKDDYFSESANKKFMFLPVDWRSSLILDEGIIDSITVKNIQYIRSKLNYSALDIMYYSSPMYKAEIMNSLTSELNRLYKLFCEHNPYFEPKNGFVSLIAHSLGSVVIYDVLTSNTRYFDSQIQENIIFKNLKQNHSVLADQYLDYKKKIQDIEKELIRSNDKNITPLEFKIENLFFIGSPLAVFLALRGVRPIENGNQEHILSKNLCRNFYNIFHPSDPVAYRLEPLILKHYSLIPALEIQKCEPTLFKTNLISYKESHEKRFESVLKGEKKDLEYEYENEESQTSDDLENDLNNKIKLENAIDYQLQESSFELMALLTSHNCYWKSNDAALFISTKLIQNETFASQK